MANEARETGTETVQMTGECRFCGQSWFVKINADATEAELEEAATSECSCASAERYRTRVQRTEAAKEHIERLFGEKADGYSQPEAVVNLMRQAVDQIDCGEVKNATINMNNGLKCKIALVSGEKIKVSREVKSVVEYKK